MLYIIEKPAFMQFCNLPLCDVFSSPDGKVS